MKKKEMKRMNNPTLRTKAKSASSTFLPLLLLLPLGLLGACAGTAPAPEAAGEHSTVANAGGEMCAMCQKKMAARHAHGDAHKEHHGENPYSCPMHPQEVAAEAGACPVCGMDMMMEGGGSMDMKEGGGSMDRMEGGGSMDMDAKNAEPAANNTAPRVEISVVENGFRPEKINVQKGQPVTLVFTRQTDKTCTKEVILELGADKKIKRNLPLNKPVAITATFTKSGTLSYACGMNMNTGVIMVQ